MLFFCGAIRPRVNISSNPKKMDKGKDTSQEEAKKMAKLKESIKQDKSPKGDKPFSCVFAAFKDIQSELEEELGL